MSPRRPEPEEELFRLLPGVEVPGCPLAPPGEDELDNRGDDPVFFESGLDVVVKL